MFKSIILFIFAALLPGMLLANPILLENQHAQNERVLRTAINEGNLWALTSLLPQLKLLSEQGHIPDSQIPRYANAIITGLQQPNDAVQISIVGLLRNSLRVNTLTEKPANQVATELLKAYASPRSRPYVAYFLLRMSQTVIAKDELWKKGLATRNPEMRPLMRFYQASAVKDHFNEFPEHPTPTQIEEARMFQELTLQLFLDSNVREEIAAEAALALEARERIPGLTHDQCVRISTVLSSPNASQRLRGLQILGKQLVSLLNGSTRNERLEGIVTQIANLIQTNTENLETQRGAMEQMAIIRSARESHQIVLVRALNHPNKQIRDLALKTLSLSNFSGNLQIQEELVALIKPGALQFIPRSIIVHLLLNHNPRSVHALLELIEIRRSPPRDSDNIHLLISQIQSSDIPFQYRENEKLAVVQAFANLLSQSDHNDRISALNALRMLGPTEFWIFRSIVERCILDDNPQVRVEALRTADSLIKDGLFTPVIILSLLDPTSRQEVIDWVRSNPAIRNTLATALERQNDSPALHNILTSISKIVSSGKVSSPELVSALARRWRSLPRNQDGMDLRNQIAFCLIFSRPEHASAEVLSVMAEIAAQSVQIPQNGLPVLRYISAADDSVLLNLFRSHGATFAQTLHAMRPFGGGTDIVPLCNLLLARMVEPERRNPTPN